MEEERIGIHKLALIERNNLNISGVCKVLSSSVNCICVKLKDTDLSVLGTNLSIENFNNNTLIISGIIDCLKYSKVSKIKEGFFKRIFK